MASSTHTALSTQVGGHPGILSDPSGEVVIKPLLPVEQAFYELLNAGDARLSALRGLTPDFMGVLELQGELQNGKELDGAAAGQLAMGKEVDGVRPIDSHAKEGKKHIVLSNLSSPFKRPCTLDIKLGTVLYDENATEEKRLRMEQRARETTSGETGVRLTGFQNWDSSAQTVVTTDKSFGRALKPADLPSGIARFLPVQTSQTSTGLPADLLLAVLDRLVTQVEHVHDALARTEAHFVGMSLLVIYEGDAQVLRAALEDGGSSDVGSEGEADDDDGASEDDDEPPSLRLATRVKLIDFAHSRPVAEGHGPDQSVLKGVRTVLELLRGRRVEVVAQTGGPAS